MFVLFEQKAGCPAPHLSSALSQMRILGTAPDTTVKASSTALVTERHLETQ